MKHCIVEIITEKIFPYSITFQVTIWKKHLPT